MKPRFSPDLNVCLPLSIASELVNRWKSCISALPGRLHTWPHLVFTWHTCRPIQGGWLDFRFRLGESWVMSNDVWKMIGTRYAKTDRIFFISWLRGIVGYQKNTPFPLGRSTTGPQNDLYKKGSAGSSASFRHVSDNNMYNGVYRWCRVPSCDYRGSFRSICRYVSVSVSVSVCVSGFISTIVIINANQIDLQLSSSC